MGGWMVLGSLSKAIISRFSESEGPHLRYLQLKAYLQLYALLQNLQGSESVMGILSRALVFELSCAVYR